MVLIWKETVEDVCGTLCLGGGGGGVYTDWICRRSKVAKLWISWQYRALLAGYSEGVQ